MGIFARRESINFRVTAISQKINEYLFNTKQAKYKPRQVVLLIGKQVYLINRVVLQ